MEKLSNPIILFTIISSLILVSFSLSVDVEGKVNIPILEKINFTNDLEWEISSFYISSADSDYFGGEILSARGKEVLPSGGSLILFMVPGEYDILLFDVDYDIWSGKCFISGSDNGEKREGPIYISFNEVDLFYEEFGLVDETYDVEIEVYTPEPVDYLFFSPSDSNSWGVDYLGEISLVNGDVYSFSFMKTDPPTTFDLQVIFNDGNQLLLEVDGSGDAAFSLGIPPDEGKPDNDIPDNSDDDEQPIDQLPGGGGENLDDDMQSDEEDRSTSSLGMVALIFCLIFVGLLGKRMRKN
jgi:hypothetical protein